MDDSTLIYRAQTPEDLLNTLPVLFGFVPTESIVVVQVQGESHRLGVRLRIDLPEPGDSDHAIDYAAEKFGQLGAEFVLVIVLSEDPHFGEDLLYRLERALGRSSILLGMWATADRYWTWHSDCPAAGWPYEQSGHHLARVHAVGAGLHIFDSRGELARIFDPIDGIRRDLASQQHWEKVRAVSALVDAGRSWPDLHREHLGPLFVRSLTTETLNDDDLVELSVWSSYTRMRDLLWFGMRHNNARDLLQLWIQVSRVAVPEYRAAPLSLASFAAWLVGDGARASVAAERALEADPEYSLAIIMLEVLHSGMDPRQWNPDPI